MAIILNLIPDIEDQIIKLLHIGELIRLSSCCQLAYKKIINYLPYKSAKQFYNNLDLPYYQYRVPVFEQYFLAACRQGKFEIIKYLLEKYNLKNMLKKGYKEILKTNNIIFIQQFSQEFRQVNFKSVGSRKIYQLSPNIIEFIYGLDNFTCNQAGWQAAVEYNNYELMTYIYTRANILISAKSSINIIYATICSHADAINRLKWLITNCKIDSRISLYFGTFYNFAWLYYDSKYNRTKYSDLTDQFLIKYGKIYFEDGQLSLLDNLFPNQIDQLQIFGCIQVAMWSEKLDICQYLIQNFLMDSNYIINLLINRPRPILFDCLLDKLNGNLSELFKEIYGLSADILLTEKLIARNQIGYLACTEENFILAANNGNHVILKYIFENSKLDLLKIKKKLPTTTSLMGSKTIEFLMELGLFNFENIKKYLIPHIFAGYIYRTDLLPLIIREIKKAKYEPEFDINKLFWLASTVSKKQAKLVYDNWFINLDKNQMVWLLDKN